MGEISYVIDCDLDTYITSTYEVYFLNVYFEFMNQISYLITKHWKLETLVQNHFVKKITIISTKYPPHQHHWFTISLGPYKNCDQHNEIFRYFLYGYFDGWMRFGLTSLRLYSQHTNLKWDTFNKNHAAEGVLVLPLSLCMMGKILNSIFPNKRRQITFI